MIETSSFAWTRKSRNPIKASVIRTLVCSPILDSTALNGDLG